MKSGPGANAYVGTDGELRVMSEGLFNNGIYRAIRVSAVHAENGVIYGSDSTYLNIKDGYIGSPSIYS